MAAKERKTDKTQQSEFRADPDYCVLFATNKMPLGRLLAPTKAAYHEAHPDDFVIFNANIITKSTGKIWYGDIDVDLDFDNLKNIADILKEDLYILMEGDARFGYENEPINKLIKKARVIIRCNPKLKVKNEKPKSK